MRRIVLDSCVVVSAFRSRLGASSRLIELAADRRLVLLVTTALFLEYEEVLKRAEQRAVTALSVKQIDRMLSALASVTEPVGVYFAWRPQLTDPDDEMVLEAAVSGRADALVTHNLSDFARAAPQVWGDVADTRPVSGKDAGMTKAYPIKLPLSVQAAATRLAKEDGVSLNDWIASAVAQKVGAVETAAEFFRRRAGDARPEDLHALLALAPDRAPDEGDELPAGI